MRAGSGEEGYEVELKTSITAKQGDTNAFIVELVYAGLFGIRNLPDENLEPFLLIECPRLIFPFARRIIADATRDGGFPPLMLDPVDFAFLYQQQRSQATQQPGQDQPSRSTDALTARSLAPDRRLEFLDKGFVSGDFLGARPHGDAARDKPVSLPKLSRSGPASTPG